MKRIQILSVVLLAAVATHAVAKLPPPDEAGKAKAAETAARTAWSNKVADYQLCRSMDRIAAAYRNEARKTGKAAPPPVDTPACNDPGAFSYTPVDASNPPPIEAAGAHSPAKTATAPHNTTAPAASAPVKR